jgi:hypothetical protein
LSFCWIIKLERAGASKMITEMTTIATTMLVATLPAALFLFGGSVGTETKLFRTPHRGQADNNESYL